MGQTVQFATSSDAGESLSGSRSTKSRRTRSEVHALRAAIKAVVAENRPVTVRQAYYQLVSRGEIDKTEAAYKTVVRLLGIMRRERAIPFRWLADNTRWMHKPDTYSSLGAMLEYTQSTYRRAIWDEQDAYVEVWLEKDALAGVLYPITSEFDVPLMVTRGYPSITFLHSAAETIAAIGKSTFVYYFGDFDPSGLNIAVKVEEGLREFAPEADIHFDRVAVTAPQIESLNLPTRPTKTTDSRSKGFVGGSVEVDAIPPAHLKRLVRACIEQHVDERRLEQLRRVEEQERATLERMAEGFT